MNATAPRVFGADEQDAVAVDVRRWIGLAQLVLDAERADPDMEMAVIFVDEQSIADLNERFLDGTGPTDVLAFPLDEPPPPGGRRPDQGGRGPGAPDEPSDPPLVLGDVVVCPAVAARQAAERDASLDDELALLVVHGVLHLLEYDHAEPADAERMRRRERELLARFAALDDPGPDGMTGEGAPRHDDPDGDEDLEGGDHDGGDPDVST